MDLGYFAAGLGHHRLAQGLLKIGAAGAGNIPHRSGGGVGGGESPGIVHPYLHLADQSASGSHQLGGGNRLHPAGEGLHSAADGHLGGLASPDALGLSGVEGQGDGEGGGVGHLGDGGTRGDQVPPLNQHLLHHPGPAGPDGEVAGQVVIGSLLGLSDRQLRLLDAHFRVLGVQAVEDVTLLHPVAHLEGGLQHLAGDQGL